MVIRKESLKRALAASQVEYASAIIVLADDPMRIQNIEFGGLVGGANGGGIRRTFRVIQRRRVTGPKCPKRIGTFSFSGR